MGLKYDDLVDEFNEYLFDYTSKISLDEIEAAKKEELNKDDKIRSPYTIDYYSKNNIWIYIIIALALIAVVVLIMIFR